MRRNASRSQQQSEDSISSVSYQPLLFSESPGTDDFLKMERLSSRSANNNSSNHRFENTIEAKVEPADTLQAIALRFHVTVEEIKRLNKIDKDNEIHARKVVKIPVTVHSVLLDNMPTVHKSGNNSPKPNHKSDDNSSRGSNSGLSSIVRNPLEDAEVILSEKLMVASVNSSGSDGPSTSRARDGQINNIIMNTKLQMGVNIYKDEESATDVNDASLPLITDILDDSTNVPNLHRIRGPSTFDWSGSDCDMSWVCLFVVILALCFVIPLIYVVYIAEHAHHNVTGATTTTVAGAVHH